MSLRDLMETKNDQNGRQTREAPQNGNHDQKDAVNSRIKFTIDCSKKFFTDESRNDFQKLRNQVKHLLNVKICFYKVTKRERFTTCQLPTPKSRSFRQSTALKTIN